MQENASFIYCNDIDTNDTTLLCRQSHNYDKHTAMSIRDNVYTLDAIDKIGRCISASLYI